MVSLSVVSISMNENDCSFNKKKIMKKLIDKAKKTSVFLLFMLTCVCAGSCSGSDNEDLGPDEEKGKGSVKITSIEAVKKSTTGLQINVSIQASGVLADEVKMLGVMGGATSDAEGSLWASVGAGKTSGNTKIVAGLRSKTTYYVKAYLKTKEGTVYSPIKKVTTP